MRVILSRKGFDSKYGGHPSPILPDGTLISLPIPMEHELRHYGDLKCGQGTYVEMANELGCGLTPDDTCHLDPDLVHGVLDRPPGWRPLFGQDGIAQRHLDRHGVAEGDLFLFFGWFRQTTDTNGNLIFDRRAPHIHVIFGYLQVGRKLRVTPDTVEDWTRGHPHGTTPLRPSTNNTLYIAAPSVSWDRSVPGAGVLDYHSSRVLTKAGCTRSVWQLPEFLRETTITYHAQKSWGARGFQFACIGQEFVVAPCDGLEAWARQIIGSSGSPTRVSRGAGEAAAVPPVIP